MFQTEKMRKRIYSSGVNNVWGNKATHHTLHFHIEQHMRIVHCLYMLTKVVT